MKKILIVVAMLSLTLVACGSAAGKNSPKPRFVAAMNACFSQSAIGFLLEDKGKTIHVKMSVQGVDYPKQGVAPGDVTCLLSQLKAPTSAKDKMNRTSALMGLQTDTWDGIEASWTYSDAESGGNGFDLLLVDKS